MIVIYNEKISSFENKFYIKYHKKVFFTLLKNILSLIAKIKKQNRVNILYFCELSS